MGGGVYNVGTMKLDPSVVIYNNHAANAGDTASSRCDSVGYTAPRSASAAALNAESVDWFTKKPLAPPVTCTTAPSFVTTYASASAPTATHTYTRSPTSATGSSFFSPSRLCVAVKESRLNVMGNAGLSISLFSVWSFAIVASSK